MENISLYDVLICYLHQINTIYFTLKNTLMSSLFNINHLKNYKLCICNSVRLTKRAAPMVGSERFDFYFDIK